jgi:hypothetical protein
MRANASTTFEKDFYKLMNNSVFGKLMEDVRRHSNIELVTDERRMKKLSASPRFKRVEIFTESLCGVEMEKKVVELNKPIYAGFAVLDISKTLMYDFHYNVMKKKYGANLTLLFTDTDSLCYSIETDDFYKDISSLSSHFDFSDYPPAHPLYSIANKKVVGKFKDETSGRPPHEFVGLRSKMYSLLLDGETSKQTMKGIPRHIKHRHESYKECLLSKRDEFVTFNTIQSKDHTVCTKAVIKKSLSSFDDKRYLLSNGINSLPYGHYSLL